MRALRRWLRRTITYKWARRLVVGLIGSTLLLLGIAMILLPGPAVIVIPLGLAVLGLEFSWARLWLRRIKARAQGAVQAWNGRKPPP